MSRFGDIDYTGLERTRRLLTNAANASISARQQQIADERNFAEKMLELSIRRKALEDERAVQKIMQDTAKELERGSVSITPTMPDVMPGTSVPISVPNVNRRPLSPQERNEVLMRGALRTAGIGEGGRKVADVLTGFRERPGTPYFIFSHQEIEEYPTPDGRKYPYFVNVYKQINEWGQEVGKERRKEQGPWAGPMSLEDYTRRAGGSPTVVLSVADAQGKLAASRKIIDDFEANPKLVEKYQEIVRNPEFQQAVNSGDLDLSTAILAKVLGDSTPERVLTKQFLGYMGAINDEVRWEEYLRNLGRPVKARVKKQKELKATPISPLSK
jgi:hypothetical protein